MELNLVIKELENLTDEKAKKVYSKYYGYSGYGIKLGDLRKLAKKIGVDHELALKLWEYDNTDVQYLALMICEANKFSSNDVTSMLSSIKYHLLAGEFVNKVLLLHDSKDVLAKEWQLLNDDNLRYGAFNILAVRAKNNMMCDTEIEKYLEVIKLKLKDETEHSKWAMNQLLCYIGIYNPKYTDICIDIGKDLGVYADLKVAKGCTSAYAPDWINKGIEKFRK